MNDSATSSHYGGAGQTEAEALNRVGSWEMEGFGREERFVCYRRRGEGRGRGRERGEEKGEVVFLMV